MTIKQILLKNRVLSSPTKMRVQHIVENDFWSYSISQFKETKSIHATSYNCQPKKLRGIFIVVVKFENSPKFVIFINSAKKITFSSVKGPNYRQ